METNRLKLRKYQSKEKTDFIELFTNKDIMKFVDNGVFSREKAENLWKKIISEFYPNGKDTIYGIFVKANMSYIGHAWIRPNDNDEWEIGYILKKDYWQNGLGTEIAQYLIKIGKERLGLEAVYASVDVENYASRRVLEKSGMSYLRDEYDEKGKFLIYSTISQS